MEDSYQSSDARRSSGKRVRVFVYSVLLVAVVALVLPFTQQLSEKSDTRTVRSVDVALPPPPPPPPEPPPPAEEKTEPPKPELKSQPKPMSLSQLQLAMNPGMGDGIGAAFGLGSFDVDTNAMDDIQMFSLAELDELPRVVKQPPWNWPRHAIGRVKADIKGYANIIINERGMVQFRRWASLSDDIVEAEMTEWLEDFRFTVPTRDGKAGRVVFRFPITLSKP